MTETLRVVVTGGGTGGRTYPALAVATRLRHESAGPVEVLWAGQAGSLEQRTAADAGIAFAPITVGKLRRSRPRAGLLSRANLADAGRIPIGIGQALRLLSDFDPHVVLGTGGYVTVPVGVATRLRGTALIVHEQATGLGLANRVLARWATHVALTSPASTADQTARATITGNPIRAGLTDGDPDHARTMLGEGFDYALPTVYITSGTQGDTQINDTLTALLPWLLRHANVIHQTGPGNLDPPQAAADTLPLALAVRYKAIGIVPSAMLAHVLALADVVVSRSGSGTIAELTAIGTPMLLLPLACSAGSEQATTARHLVEKKAAVAVLGEITAHTVQAALDPLLADPTLRTDLATRARELGRPDATETLCELVLTTATAATR